MDQPRAHQDTGEARDLVDQAEAAMEAGDYRLARELADRVQQVAPASDLAHQVRAGTQRLRIDRIALYSGAFATALYLLGWLLSLW